MDDGASDDDLMGFVLKVTYGGLLADAMDFAGAATPPTRLHTAPERFSTRLGMENTRRDIIALCTAHGADEGLQSFLSTRWLERFAPLAS